jgi:ribokinase
MSVCVLGSLNLDIVARVADLPKPGETVMCRSVERFPGGKRANQAVAAARCGVRTHLIGAIGRDDAGDAMLSALRRYGVETGGVRRLNLHPTGQAFIFVADSGENSIVVAGGANQAVRPDMTDADTAARSRVLLAQLETPVATIEALFGGAAGAAGCLRMLNAAPASPEGRRLFPLVDVLIVNETELAAFAGVAPAVDDLDAMADAATSLIARDGQTVIVTLGAAGALAVGGGRRIVAAGRPARVVDTTGAGDCFCGVLAARLAEDADLAEALRWANAAAALSTERPGATPSMPSRAEIEAAL